MRAEWNADVHRNDPFEPGPVTVVERRPLAPNIQLLTVQAPVVARKIQPGQFVIIRPDDVAERTPLTVADWDRDKGTVTSIFMTVGTSTYKMSRLKPGDTIPTYVGPLGHPIELANFGTVVLIGGCYGIGIIYPMARALKEQGNHVISIVEGRSKFLLYWQDRLEAVSDRVIYATKDLSVGRDRDPGDAIEKLLAAGGIDRVYAIGCTFMMYELAHKTKPFGVKTIALFVLLSKL